MGSKTLLLPAFAGLSLLSLGLVSTIRTASAQSAPQDTIATLEFHNADAREAIRQLFKTGGRSFTVDPAVQGSVTLSLRNVSFDTALTNLTRQVDATYRVEDSRYEILPLAALPEPARPQIGGFGGGQGGGAGAGAEPPAMVVDGGYLYVLHRSTLYKIDKKTMSLSGQLALGPRGFGAPGQGRPGQGRPGGGFGDGGGLGGGQP